MTSKFRISSTWLSLLLLTSCVTINIYFPAAAAEKAADRIIDKVWGEEGEQNSAPEESVPETSAWTPILLAALDFVISPASAEMDFSVETPLIKKIVASMNQRHGQLADYYDSGVLGLTNNATIEVRDIKAVALPQRPQLNKLVGAENSDRAALYAAIAAANGHPEWETQVRDTFTRRWIGKARPGWWYQDQAGGWLQK